MINIQDTTYPTVKSGSARKKLMKAFSPDSEDIRFVREHARGLPQQVCFLILLKTAQRLARFLPVKDIPEQVIKIVSEKMGLKNPPEEFKTYDRSGSKARHVLLIRKYLNIIPFGKDSEKYVRGTAEKTARVKTEPADIINVIIEELIKKRTELPAFRTLSDITMKALLDVNNEYFRLISNSISETSVKRLDSLLQSGNRNKTDWDLIRKDSGAPTVKNIRALINKLKWLRKFSLMPEVIRSIPDRKIRKLSEEAMSLDAGSMVSLRKNKRYTLLILGVRHRKARVYDDLGGMLIKRVRKMNRLGKLAMDEYHLKHINEAHYLIKILKDVLSSSQEGLSDKKFKAIAGENPEKIIQKCESFNAHANNNYFHFLAPFYKGVRAALFQILQSLKIKASGVDTSTEKTIQYLLSLHKMKAPKVPLSVTSSSENGPTRLLILPTGWISENWKVLIFNKKNVQPEDPAERKFLEICAFCHIANELQTGDLYIPGAEDLSDYREQFISWEEYEEKIKEYSDQAGIPVTGKRFTLNLMKKMDLTATKVDQGFPENEHVSINKGEPYIKKYTKNAIPKGFQDADAALTKKIKKTNVVDILRDSQYWIDWCKPFGPVSGMKAKISEQLTSYITTTFCYGCGLGPSQTSRSIPGSDRRKLSFIHDRHVTEDMLDDANIRVINSYRKFSLTKHWGQGKSSSADGTKWNIYEKNLLSEYHIRYGGYGGIGYYHVADNYIAFFSRFIPCGVWEGIHILDGLMQHNSDLEPDTVYSDTQGQNAPIFGLAYLLGINLMPRIRNWKNLIMFRSGGSQKFEHIDDLFSDKINWSLIEKNLKDMLRVALSVREGKITASTILKRLGTKNRKNKLYYAFRELGRATRTIFLLDYIHSLELRKVIQSGTNKSEAFNGFTKWVSFGKNATISANDREDQRKAIKFNHLVSNLIILHNADAMTKAINKLKSENIHISSEIKKALSPYRTEHINRFGIYQIDVLKKPAPIQFSLGNEDL